MVFFLIKKVLCLGLFLIHKECESPTPPTPSPTTEPTTPAPTGAPPCRRLRGVDGDGEPISVYPLKVSIQPDDKGYEMSWSLTKSSDGTIVKSVATNTIIGTEKVEYEFNAPSGTYTFTIYDSAGDGMQGNGEGVEGAYFVHVGDDLVAEGEKTNDFGFEESTTFTIEEDISDLSESRRLEPC